MSEMYVSRYDFKGFKGKMSSQLNSITEQLTTNEGTSRTADLESRKEDESANFWNLLKKTQSQVTSLENEIRKIEAENIHQEKG